VAEGDISELAARANQLYQDVADGLTLGRSPGEAYSKTCLTIYNHLVTKAQALYPDLSIEPFDDSQLIELKPLCGQLKAILAVKAAPKARSIQAQ
jgi:hypothetical protein